MQEYRADTAALRLIQVILCLLAAGLSAAAAQFLSPWAILMWIVIAVFVGIAVIVSFLLLPLLFRRLRCVTTSSRVSVRSGILLQREQSIRLNTVQFVQIISGPFDGKCGLNFVILHVYGGSLAVLFLSKEEREEFTAFLIRKGVFHAP